MKSFSMRKFFLLAIATTAVLLACKGKKTVGANGIVYKSPSQYNDYIINRQGALTKRVLDFSRATQAGDLDSAERVLDICVKETGTMITDIKGMPPFKGDSAFRDASVSLFSFYKRVFDKEYRDIIHLRKEQDGTSVEIEDRINALVSDIQEDEKGYDKKFQSTQKAFAASNNMRLEENDTFKKFKQELEKNK